VNSVVASRANAVRGVAGAGKVVWVREKPAGGMVRRQSGPQADGDARTLLDPHNPLIAVTQRRGRAAPNRAVAA
jgi:hypothetical protein